METVIPDFRIDFLPEEYRRRLQARREVRPRLTIFVLLLLGTGIVWWWVETELRRLQVAVEAHRQATRGIETLQEKASALRTELARLESQAKHFLVGRRWVPKTQIIDTLVRTRPKQVAWDELVIRDDEGNQSSSAGQEGEKGLRPSGKTAGSFGSSGQGRQKSPVLQERTIVNLTGSTPSVDLLHEYLQSLGAIPFIRNVELVQSIIETGGGGALRFEIRLEVHAKGYQASNDSCGNLTAVNAGGRRPAQ
jgi:hypothetical protein